MCVAYFYDDKAQIPHDLNKSFVIVKPGLTAVLPKGSSFKVGAVITQDDGWMTIEGMPCVTGAWLMGLILSDDKMSDDRCSCRINEYWVSADYSVPTVCGDVHVQMELFLQSIRMA